MADLDRVARAYRDALAAREAEALRAMWRALAVTEQRIDVLVRGHLATIRRAQARGVTPGITARYELGRLEALRGEVRDTMRAYGRTAAATTGALTEQAAAEAIGFSDRFVRDVGGPSWVMQGLRPDVVAQARAYQAPGSPLADLFARFGPDAAERVSDGITAGIALGHHPDRIARTIRADVRETYRGRSRLIARTESQRVARAVTLDRYQRHPDVLAGWRWHASIDDRCCEACWAEHGLLYPLSAPLDGHPGCRCVMVPALRSEFLAEGEPDPVTGEEAFAELAPEDQRRILGPSKHDAYRAGEIRLTDLSERVSSPRWGTSVRASSLARARERARAGTRSGGPPGAARGARPTRAPARRPAPPRATPPPPPSSTPAAAPSPPPRFRTRDEAAAWIRAQGYAADVNLGRAPLATAQEVAEALHDTLGRFGVTIDAFGVGLPKGKGVRGAVGLHVENLKTGARRIYLSTRGASPTSSARLATEQAAAHAAARERGIVFARRSLTDARRPPEAHAAARQRLADIEAAARFTTYQDAPRATYSIVTHEAGHAVDKARGIVKSGRWDDALRRAGVTRGDRYAVSEYGASSPVELFAEAFTLYVEGRPLPRSVRAALEEVLAP